MLPGVGNSEMIMVTTFVGVDNPVRTTMQCNIPCCELQRVEPACSSCSTYPLRFLLLTVTSQELELNARSFFSQMQACWSTCLFDPVFVPDGGGSVTIPSLAQSLSETAGRLGKMVHFRQGKMDHFSHSQGGNGCSGIVPPMPACLARMINSSQDANGQFPPSATPPRGTMRRSHSNTLNM